MTKGMRWLVGGLASVVFLLASLPFAYFGALLGTMSRFVDQTESVGTVTGTVEEVLDSPDPDSDSGSSYMVRVRYIPAYMNGQLMDEKEGLADWAGDSAPVIGQLAPVHYFYFGGALPVEAGSQAYTALYTGEDERKESLVLFGIAGGLFGAGVLGLVLTLRWVARAPASLSAVEGSADVAIAAGSGDVSGS